MPNSEAPDAPPDNEDSRRASIPQAEVGPPPFPPPGEPVPLGHALFRVMRNIMFDEKPLPELDALPLAQMRLLWTVFHGSDATMKDYSERLKVSQSTVTQLADRLIKRGMVARYADPDDRRIVRLRISPEGAQALRTAKDREYQTHLAVWNALTSEEREAVMRGLDILGHTAEAVRAAQGRALPCGDSPWDKPETERANNITENDSPVVNLMTRRVRGKSS